MLGRRLEGKVHSDSSRVTAELLTDHGGMRLIAGLGATLHDGLKDDRVFAAIRLGVLGSHARPAVPGLHQALQHPDMQLRVAAVALARTEPEDETATPQVLAWLESSATDQSVRAAAREAIQAIVPAAK